jgi:nicotinate (nicotinamide) nucleotide adenylyltransferase
MGGTFDPVHHGHLSAASEVAARFRLDEVVFVPTGSPWQKSHRDVSPAEDRYLMTVVATASNPRFSVSRIEVDRPGATYTIDTLRELRARTPAPSCSSSPALTRWPRSSAGTPPRSCSSWLTSSASAGPATSPST